MKLLKLYSDNEKFRTINFKNGLNIVASIQKSEKDKDTYNGVGKSLSLLLIHLILGATFPQKNAQFKSYLEKYGKFYLDVQVADNKYTFTKNFSESSYYINHEKHSLVSFSDALNKIFSLEDTELSFRQVFNCFARRYGGTYYSNYLTQQGQPLTDFNQKVVNFKLLGFYSDLVGSYRDLKTQLKNNKIQLDGFKENSKGQNRAKLLDLNDAIGKLTHAISTFKVAQNFEELKKKADSLTLELNEVRNSIRNMQNKKYKLNQNLNLIHYTEVNPQEIVQTYEEAKFHFENKIIKRIEDAQNYHITLLKNRKERLLSEIQEINNEISVLNSAKEKLAAERDSLLQLLDDSGALQEYQSLIQRRSELENERSKIRYTQERITELEEEKLKLDTDKLSVKNECNEYLLSVDSDVKIKENIFRAYVKQFYENQGGSFTLNTTKDAQYLYDIDVQIPKEKSQGVEEVKIFCYDILLYLQNRSKLNFLAHDSCIFAGMDPRQQTKIFQIILELVSKYDLQYFVNINQNSLEEVLTDKTLTANEKEEIESSICLKLYDKNSESWLFGEQFD